MGSKAMTSVKPDSSVNASAELRGWIMFKDGDGTITQAFLVQNIIAVSTSDAKTTSVALADGSWYASAVSVSGVLSAMADGEKLAQRRRRTAS